MVRVLSLDGGGVRGVLQARVLQRLESKGAFIDKVDCFAGSSVGAINAIWLASGRPLDMLIDLYRKAAPFIFGGGRSSLAFFAKSALRGQLRSYLGDAKLGDLKRPVLTGAVTSQGPKFFDPRIAADRDELLVDVLLAATAAVPLLPPHKGHVDGGLLANDPSAVALKWIGGFPVLDCDIALLSVGTGEAPAAPAKGFLRAVVNAVGAGASMVTETTCRMRLGDRYCRAQPQLPRAIELHDAGAVDELVRAANDWDHTATAAWIARCF